MARRLESEPELGYRVIGFVDDEWEGSEAFHASGFVLACDLAGFRSFLRSTVVDEVMIALPDRSMFDRATQIAVICEEQGITVWIVSRLSDVKTVPVFAEAIGNDVVTTYQMTSMYGWPVQVKRALDIVVSLTALVICSPILALSALAITISSPGPIVFSQRRLGFNKRPFNVYKFRTMVVNAEERLHELERHNQVSGPVFKMWDDPRVTTTREVPSEDEH